MAPINNPAYRDLTATVGTVNMVGVVLSTITYGVHFTLFAFLIRLYVSRAPYVCRSRRSPKPDWRPLAYASVLFTLATAGLCLQVSLNHSAFIENHDYPGGPLAYIAAQVESPRSVAVTAVYVVLNWFADGMLLYRFFVLFQRSGLVLCLSIAMIVSLVALGSISIRDISKLDINLWSGSSTALSLAYLALSFSINVILTTTIIGRLYLLRRQIPDVLGERSGRLYTSLITMFVESASLYTIIAFASIVACAVNSPAQNALLPMLGQMQAIPTLLIAIRVMEYRAITPENFTDTLSSSLEFQRPSPSPIFFADEPKPPPYALSRNSTITYQKLSLDLHRLQSSDRSICDGTGSAISDEKSPYTPSFTTQLSEWPETTNSYQKSWLYAATSSSQTCISLPPQPP